MAAVFPQTGKKREFSQFLKAMNFKHTDFDGCMYGLVSRRGGSDGIPVRTPWRIAFINSTIGKHLHLLCDGSHPHVPCNGPDAIYSQGYTPTICRAVTKSMQDGKIHPYHTNTCIMNVCMSVSFEAQTNSAICVGNPLIGCSDHLLDPPESRMASRRGPSQAKGG